MAQQPFSFPYPKNLPNNASRPAGQGCKACVHQTYCPALYWFRRGGDGRGFREEPVKNLTMGTACASWSDDVLDQVKTVNQRDRNEEEYMFLQNIGSEANRGGITDQVTGTGRRP